MKLVHRTKPILGHGDYNFERGGMKYRGEEWRKSNLGLRRGERVRGIMDRLGLARKTDSHHARGEMAMSY